jgi:chloramphenicol-sensitive protein RarD
MNPAFIYAILAFLIWGCFPIIFDFLSFATAWEILFHRILWSALLITPITLFINKISVLELISRVREHLLVLSVSALLISVNWLVFVYAVLENRVLETSLGYFTSPLCSVLIGMTVFAEKLSRYEKIALALMVLALLIKAIEEQGIPWIALSLALTFSAYGAMHKRNNIPSDVSLTLETWLLMPFSLLGIYWLAQAEVAVFGESIYGTVLLMIMGVVTVTPLWLFIRAAKGMRLSQLGFFNYLTPSVSFLLGLFYFNESLVFLDLLSFLLIWVALILVSLHNLRRPS